MTPFLALLRLQLLSRFADYKPKNLRKAMEEKRGKTVGMFLAILFLIGYLGVILYIVETKALDVLTPAAGAPAEADLRNLLVILAVVLSTGGTLVLAFFFVMSSLYLGRDTVFMASLPLKPRTVLTAKLVQIWLSETLIDAVILLPACILYGTRVGVSADFYIRMVLVWLIVAILPVSIAAILSAFLTRLTALWKHREIVMTVGGFALFIAYMILMMNVGSITGDSAEGGEMLSRFFRENQVRIAGMTSYFPPAGWAAEGILGDWGKLALYAAVSFGAAALVIGVLGIFYRKLSLLQAETPQATSRKGIQKGSIREGNAFKANVRREFVSILRVPSYAINILPIAFMPLLMVVMIGFSMNRGGSNGQAAFISIGQTSSAAIMCIMAAVIAFMSGMNPALSTAVTREGKGHDFIKALPVSPRTIIHAKIAVGFGLEVLGVVAAGIAFSIQVPGFVIETVMAIVLCLLFSFAASCLALSRDVKKPKLDWVTEQEAVKQNFGVLISMLVSWATLAALGALGFVLVTSGWTLIPVFAVLAVILALMSFGAYTLLMKNVDKYYVKG
ncbi:MAG: hypothetical protein IKO25_09055 [Clostridia bacterium]|nr:hypothetical protein [Clostridia bacterium]